MGRDASTPPAPEVRPTDGGADDYPLGPYGEASPPVGAVLENLQLRGFVNPTGVGLAIDTPYRDYSLSELRSEGHRYAIVLTAAVWCPSCRAAARAAAMRASEVVEAGGTMLELLLDGATARVPPTEAELRAWGEAYDLPMTTVGPADDRTRQVFSDREFGYVIDLETMRVVWRQQALFSTPTISDLAIDAFLNELP